MPLATLACTIDDSGISAPTFDEILTSLRESFQAIYGSNAYITPDSQDGQWIAALAQVINDQNQQAIAVWNSFRPQYAQGVGLSSIVKINGLYRKLPSNSAAEGDIVGVAGTTIRNGIVQDSNGNRWLLPEEVVIPFGGVINVSVTAEQPGAISAPAGSINLIATPVAGWQFFESTGDALPGFPVEVDATLRRRQSVSTALPSNSNLAGLLSGLLSVPTATRAKVYENDTAAPDINGLVPNSIAVVIEGGDNRDVAEMIGQKKSTGCVLNGTTTQSYVDPNTGISYDGAPGNPPAIKFYRLATQTVLVVLNVKTKDGWNDVVSAAIQASIAAYISALGIGDDVAIARVYSPAFLGNGPGSETFEIVSLTLDGGVIDVVVPFNKVAVTLTTDVTINVIP